MLMPGDNPGLHISSRLWPRLELVLKKSSLSGAAAKFVEAITEFPDLPVRLAKMALLFKSQKQEQDARVLASTAYNLEPANLRVRVLTDWVRRHEAPLWHFGIIHDQRRNEVYARALAHFVKPGMTVFEIGTGTGILAMLAVRAGARHVYTCERRPDVAEAARDIVALNGMSDRITVIAKDANDVRLGVDLPDRADLFVAEIVDNGLLSEGVLPLTELARAHFLKPNAVLLPRRVAARGYLVSGRGHHEQYRMESAMGFDLTPFNRFTPLEIETEPGGGQDVEALSDAQELIGFDLHEDAPHGAVTQTSFAFEQAGLAEGIMWWLHLDFGAGIVFENNPPQRSGWNPQLFIFPKAKWGQAKDTINVEISHDRDRLFFVPHEV